jgi:hypothetical protein
MFKTYPYASEMAVWMWCLYIAVLKNRELYTAEILKRIVKLIYYDVNRINTYYYY